MLAIPYNGDLSLIDYAASMNVSELYGQLSVDTFGGGRTPIGYPGIDEDNLKLAVQQAHRYNISFSYAMNFLSLANLEFNNTTQHMLLSFIDKLVDISIDSITIANPFLIHMVKSNFPNLKIGASVISDISCLEQIELFKLLGAQKIILSKSLNKDVKTLNRILKSTNVEIQLVANDPCLQYCPFKAYHNLSNGFSSMKLLQNTKHLSFCTLLCRKAFLEKPYKLIKATYIRPEDLDYYRKIGVSSFKLVDRKESSPWLKRTILAYFNETYDGNFADLCSFFSPIKGKGEIDHNTELRELSIEEITSIESINKNKNNLRFKPFIDNQKFSKYIEPVLTLQCRESDCEKCGICNKVFADIGFIDDKQRSIVLNNINLVLKAIGRREFWENS